MRVAAVVLAGGQARRMGGAEKPLLAFGGEPLLCRILRQIVRETALVALSANGDPARFAAFGLPVLGDGEFAGCGPLAGVLAALEWAQAAGADALLSVPGDVPFLPADLAALLAPPPAAAAGGGRVHPLVALWPMAAAGALRGHLGGGGARAVREFGRRIKMRVVAFADADFVNLNTPEDWAAAEALLAGAEAGRRV